jgi:hypothetical protein
MNWEAMSMSEIMDVGCNKLHRISSSSGDGYSIGLDSLLMAQYIAPYWLKTQFEESDRLEAEIKKNLAGLGYE